MSREIDLGKVMVTPGGAWRADASFEFLTVVNHKGSGWLSKVDNIGIEPGTDESVWMKLVDAGDVPLITKDDAGNIYVNGELFTTAFADAQAAANRIIEASTSIQAAEQARANAENARSAAEQQRVEAENLRQAAENGRKSNETARVNAEALRKSAETAREGSEASRVSAEQSRSRAELARSSSETTRQAQWELLADRANAAIHNATEAASTIKAKTAGRKVVIGRAIPIHNWRPGVSYFCSDGRFCLRTKGHCLDADHDILELERPIPSIFSALVVQYLRRVFFGGAAHCWYGNLSEVLINNENEVTRIVMQGLGDRALDYTDYQYGGVINVVLKLEMQCNVLTFDGSGYVAQTVSCVDGFSPYLYVTGRKVVCVKPPLVKEGVSGDIVKYGRVERRKKRTTTRGETTLKLKKVRFMRTKNPANVSFKHARKVRYQVTCRHFKSVLWKEVFYPRMKKVTAE